MEFLPRGWGFAQDGLLPSASRNSCVLNLSGLRQTFENLNTPMFEKLMIKKRFILKLRQWARGFSEGFRATLPSSPLPSETPNSCPFLLEAAARRVPPWQAAGSRLREKDAIGVTSGQRAS